MEYNSFTDEELENGICGDCRWYSTVGNNCKYIKELPIDLMSCNEFNWD